MDTNEIITAFKSAGWSGVLHRNVDNALANLNTNDSLWCGYKGQFRRVHPEVCKWHKEEHDSECTACERADWDRKNDEEDL